MPGIGLHQQVKYESSKLEGLLEEGLANVGASLNDPAPIQTDKWPYDNKGDYKTLLQYAELWRQGDIGKYARVMYLRTFRAFDGIKKPPENSTSKEEAYLDPSVVSQMFSDTDYLDLEAATFEYKGKQIALHFPIGEDNKFMVTGNIGFLEDAIEYCLGYPVKPLRHEVDNIVDTNYLREILARDGRALIDETMLVNIIIDYISSHEDVSSSSNKRL